MGPNSASKHTSKQCQQAYKQTVPASIQANSASKHTSRPSRPSNVAGGMITQMHGLVAYSVFRCLPGHMVNNPLATASPMLCGACPRSNAPRMNLLSLCVLCVLEHLRRLALSIAPLSRPPHRPSDRDGFPRRCCQHGERCARARIFVATIVRKSARTVWVHLVGAAFRAFAGNKRG